MFSRMCQVQESKTTLDPKWSLSFFQACTQDWALRFQKSLVEGFNQSVVDWLKFKDFQGWLVCFFLKQKLKVVKLIKHGGI